LSAISLHLSSFLLTAHAHGNARRIRAWEGKWGRDGCCFP
jgi:hypothetical protein